MAIKPAFDLQWATDSVTSGTSGNPNKLEPFEFKSEGQQEGLPVPRQYLNFQFDALRQWKDYLEETTDDLLASSGAALLRTNNLSDLTNAATARTNLGLTSVASSPYTTALQAATGSSQTVVMNPAGTTDHFNARTTALTRVVLGRTDAASIRTDIGAQTELGFTPVQQGGGPAGLFNNKIYIGWNGAGLAVTVDSSNYGTTWPINVTGNASSVTNGVYTSGNQTIAGTKTFTSQVLAPSFRVSSDPELKDSLVEHASVANVDKIKLMQWVWKQHDNVPVDLQGKEDSGVDASVVKQVFPNCVGEDTNGFLVVDYAKLAVHLILAKGE